MQEDQTAETRARLGAKEGNTLADADAPRIDSIESSLCIREVTLGCRDLVTYKAKSPDADDTKLCLLRGQGFHLLLETLQLILCLLELACGGGCSRVAFRRFEAWLWYFRAAFRCTRDTLRCFRAVLWCWRAALRKGQIGFLARRASRGVN